MGLVREKIHEQIYEHTEALGMFRAEDPFSRRAVNTEV